MMLQTISKHVLGDTLCPPHTQLCAMWCVSQTVVVLPKPDTEGICRFLEHSVVKLRFLGLLPLTHAELEPLLSGSYPIS